ncbi:hypothetical protein BDV98DRAFT_560712 [Pterulicium gracile]|uniref:Uncharacterized protein n=1 Tax=Pterulicium gracile TaxID=1884261 RepID=A0A5C3QZW0_9AGAR|nr:hypothetical protein BDV98DRAFT_560712 [Pterula gracilis]
MPSSRYASALIAGSGLLFNFGLAVNLIAASRSLRWEPESEWDSEGGQTVWRFQGVNLAWGMLSLYFASSAAVCCIGLYGIIKNKASHVRFYRDFSFADFILSTIFTSIATWGIFHTSVRTGACEELSRHPELLRATGELGLSAENCEQWFERVTWISAAGLLVMLVIRLHFLLAVSKYYSTLIRNLRPTLPIHLTTHTGPRHSMQRILLLPPSASHSSSDSDLPLIYSPVSLDSLSPDARATATEAWIARTSSDSRRQQRVIPGRGSTGRINLPISQDEPLLPSYSDSKSPRAFR